MGNATKGVLIALFLNLLAAPASAEEAAPQSSAEQAARKPSAEEQRQIIQDMRDDVLEKLFATIPDAREILENCQGYAIFSKKAMNLLLFSTARGVGILRDHNDGSDTYMKVFGAGTGIGAGVKNYSAVFVFQTPEALEDFRSKGWELTGHADADVEASDEAEGKAEEPGKEIPGILGPDVLVYQMTESGFALQALVQGFKFWVDPELNE